MGKAMACKNLLWLALSTQQACLLGNNVNRLLYLTLSTHHRFGRVSWMVTVHMATHLERRCKTLAFGAALLSLLK